jgi:cyclophilin family peptidyl-prolyl cis-trans isomerase
MKGWLHSSDAAHRPSTPSMQGLRNHRACGRGAWTRFALDMARIEVNVRRMFSSFQSVALCSLLLSCTSTTPTESASSSGTASGGTSSGSTVTTPDAAPTVVDASVDSGPEVYMPPGYTRVPMLSATPIRKFAKAEQVLDAQKKYVAVLETSVGRMVFSLYSEEAPITCNSFVFLALNRFFEGIAFHRVIEDFVIQGGDPNTVSGKRGSWGTGGPGYYFGTEIVPTLNFDSAGVVGMARADDPNSNGSQFYITLKATANLDQKYTVFAKVIEGESVLPQVVRGEPPVTPSRILQVAIGERAK